MKLLSGFLCVFILLAPIGVLARDDMSGVWKEEYTETIVSVEEWGKECGQAPRSPGRERRGILYSVEDRGMDLLFTGPSGGSFATSACQSPKRGLKVKERNLKDNLHLVNCATPETAESYESGLYSFRIKSKNRIEYRETSRYVRNVKGALCSHTRRVRRVYTRQKGAKPAAPVVGKKVEVPPEDPCETPGPAVRLTLIPEKAFLRPGQKVCPYAKAFDQNGCKTDASLTWGSGESPPGFKLDIRGCLTATQKVRAGSHQIRLAAGKAQAEITLVVRKPQPAHKPREPEKPRKPEKPPAEAAPQEVTEAAPPSEPLPPPPPVEKPVEPPEATPPPAAARPEETGTWILPAAIGGGAFLILVVVLIVFLARRKKIPATPPAQPTVPEPILPTPEPIQPTPESILPATGPETAEKVFCTHCGREIPAGAKFCPYDRTPIHRPGSPTIPSAPVCPTCKRVLPAGAKFCPYDRTKLQ